MALLGVHVDTLMAELICSSIDSGAYIFIHEKHCKFLKVSAQEPVRDEQDPRTAITVLLKPFQS